MPENVSDKDADAETDLDLCAPGTKARDNYDLNMVELGARFDKVCQHLCSLVAEVCLGSAFDDADGHDYGVSGGVGEGTLYVLPVESISLLDGSALLSVFWSDVGGCTSQDVDERSWFACGSVANDLQAEAAGASDDEDGGFVRHWWS